AAHVIGARAWRILRDQEFPRLDIDGSAAVVQLTDAAAPRRGAKACPYQKTAIPKFVHDATVHGHFSVPTGTPNRHPIAHVDRATCMEIIDSVTNAGSIA